MIKIENIVTPYAEQWKSLILGARNAMNSWEKSDSGPCATHGPAHCSECEYISNCHADYVEIDTNYIIGPNDLALMMKLRNAGTDHRKFMRMITVYVDITAPLYWWKEFDTYKVGTVTNSCSTMHKIHAKEFTLEDFSYEHLFEGDDWEVTPFTTLQATIDQLNKWRERYIRGQINGEDGDILKRYWWQMIQLLPSSYNQKRTVMLNYEVLANMYKSRRNHKLDEWHTLCDWIETLPFSELITGKFDILKRASKDAATDADQGKLASAT